VGSKYNSDFTISSQHSLYKCSPLTQNNLKCIELLEAGDLIVSVTHCVYCAEKNPTPGIERLS